MILKLCFALLFIFSVAGLGCSSADPCSLTCPSGQSCLIVDGNETCVNDGRDDGNCGSGAEGTSCQDDSDCLCSLNCTDGIDAIPTCQP